MTQPSYSKWRSFLSKQSEASLADNEPGYGIHTLVDQSQQVADAVDIVAVHGLNGHFSKTWTDSTTNFNWLRDAVPKVVSNSRVMSFSYDSALQFSKSASDIFDFADQLLEFLLARRQSAAESTRPIVICHSLGGIVFKQAMVRAFQSQRYNALLDKTVGVMFLGTPHRGSTHATLATILGRILNSAPFGTRTNTQLAKDLEPKSRILEQISRSFVERTENMAVVSFYETSKMNYVNSVIVEKDSACLGLPKEIAIPLNGNHRTICKYRSENHDGLPIILHNLKCLCTSNYQAPLRVQAGPDLKMQDKFLRSLETSSPEIHKARNPPATKGTCTWIFRHPTYQSWYSSPCSSILWLSADPGCGKSVMASFLIDYYTSRPPEDSPNTCYFFFKSDNTEQRDAIHAMQAMLRQLLFQCRSLVKVAMSCLNEHRLDSIQTLWKAFISIAEHPDAGETICILDGLDECDMASGKQLAQLLSAHFSGTLSRAVPDEPPKLKILVASRPDTAFKVLFDKPALRSDPQISMIRLRGEDEIEAITDDVSMVIKSDIADLEYQGLPSEILANIQEQLIARADRTFLWVTLILHLLKERVEAGASRRELDEILQNRDIDVIYSQLLSRRPDAPRARKVLNLVLAAHRPLTLDELSIALAIEGDSRRLWNATSPLLTTFDKIEDQLVFPFENHIKSLCGHFLRIIRNHVYLVHETARIFLLGTWKKPPLDPNSIQWKGTFEVKEAQETLLNICVTFLYCFARPSRCAVIGHASFRTSPFLEYAAKYWPMHFQEVIHPNDIDKAELNYYHNLCHPNFPGFKEWAPKALGVPLEVISPQNSTLSANGIQDFCCQNLLTRIPKGSTTFGIGDVPSRGQIALSSNPGSLSNHYFPLTVDSNGMVSLDFSKGPQNKRS